MSSENKDNPAKPFEHIVLIDDEPTVLSALKLILKIGGHTVHEFSSGFEALEHIRKGQPVDLVLCDLRMPELDGIQTLEALNSIAPGTPFILMSGHATEQDAARAVEKGALGFLAKPFTPDELTELLQQINHRAQNVLCG